MLPAAVASLAGRTFAALALPASCRAADGWSNGLLQRCRVLFSCNHVLSTLHQLRSPLLLFLAAQICGGGGSQGVLFALLIGQSRPLMTSHMALRHAGLGLRNQLARW